MSDALVYVVVPVGAVALALFVVVLGVMVWRVHSAVEALRAGQPRTALRILGGA